MSKKPEKVYVVRGFDFLSETFFSNPVGLIKNKLTFNEITVNTQAEAIITMLTDDQISTMLPLATSSIAQELIQIIDLKIGLNVTDKLAVRALKSTLREIIKHWSEKSRVKNCRGFRVSAIRTPVFEYGAIDHDTGDTVTLVRVQVLLGNAILYSSKARSVIGRDYTVAIADLSLLRKELVKQLSSDFNSLSFNHSIFGKGEVL